MIVTYILVSIFALSCHISCDESLSEAQIKQEEELDGFRFKETIESYLKKIQWLTNDTTINEKLVAFLMQHCGETMAQSHLPRKEEDKVHIGPSVSCVERHFGYFERNELMPMCPLEESDTVWTDTSTSKSCHCVCPKTTYEPNGGSVTVADLINPFPNISQISIPWNLFERIKQILGNDYLGTWQKAQGTKSVNIWKKEVAVDEVIKSYLILLLLPEYKKDPIGATNLYAYFQRKCSRNMPTYDRLFLLTAKGTYPENEKTAVVDLHSCISEYWNREDYQEDVCQVKPAAPCNCVCPEVAQAETHVFISANTLAGKETQLVIDVATIVYEIGMDDRHYLPWNTTLAFWINDHIGGAWGCDFLDKLAGNQTILHPLEIHLSIKQEGKEPALIFYYRKK